MDDEFTAEQLEEIERLLSRHFVSDDDSDAHRLAGYLQQALQSIKARAAFLRPAVLNGDMDDVRTRTALLAEQRRDMAETEGKDG